MDQTFLQLIAVIVNLTNKVAALEKENATLKSEGDSVKSTD